MAAGQCHNAVFTRLSANHSVLIVDFRGRENGIDRDSFSPFVKWNFLQNFNIKHTTRRCYLLYYEIKYEVETELHLFFFLYLNENIRRWSKCV